MFDECHRVYAPAVGTSIAMPLTLLCRSPRIAFGFHHYTRSSCWLYAPSEVRFGLVVPGRSLCGKIFACLTRGFQPVGRKRILQQSTVDECPKSVKSGQEKQMALSLGFPEF